MSIIKKGIFNSELGLMRFFGLFSGVMFPIFGYIHKINGDETDSLFLRLCLAVLCIGGISLTFIFDYFKKNYIIPVYGMSFLCILWFSYTMYSQAYTVGYSIGAFILISAPALLMKTVRVLMSFLVYCIVIIIGPAFIHEAPNFPPTILTLSMFSFSLMIFLFRRSSIRLQEKLKSQTQILKDNANRIRKQSEKLKEINDMVNDKNKSITDSIEYAESIQKAMLPSKEIFEKYFKEHFILYQPRDIVSGDFYWAHKVENKLIWAVADCTGHGVPGAFMSLISMSLMQEIVLTHKDNLKPGNLLDHLRDKIIRNLGQDKHNMRHDGLDISLCVLDLDSKILEFAGAYNSLVVYREGQRTVIKGDQQPVGVYQNQKPFQTTEFQLQDGDLLIAFTDGYTDQLGGGKRRKYSIRRLNTFLDEHNNKEMVELRESLLDEYYSWKGSEQQIDDIAILGVRI